MTTGGNTNQGTPGCSDLIAGLPSTSQEEKDTLQQEEDSKRVRLALGGGIGAKAAPDLTKQNERQEQKLNIFDNMLDLEDFDPSALPVRPAESTLPKITSKELRPPPSL